MSRPATSEASPAVSAFNPDVALVTGFDMAPKPAVAPLVTLLLDPVRLDTAVIGAEAPVEASPAVAPIADDDPGVDRLCRAWGTEEFNCADVVWALPASVPAAWETAPPVCFSADWQGKNGDTRRETEVRLLWDAEFLFVRFDARYRSITIFADGEPSGRRDGLWERDVCEIFL